MVAEGLFRTLCAKSATLLKHNPVSFKDAIRTLNNLQSNASAIAESINNNPQLREIKRDNILRYLAYTGVTPEALDALSVIHIAGTKGKGTTSSLCESILQVHGYKTGFYSSPHLLTVTERIRVDGEAITEESFTSYFNEIYHKLMINRESEQDIPAYFGFLTVMALNIFIKEKVDVAIVEVGIGGEYDQTNIVRNVPVAGITSLGLDHTAMLGNTIEKIARQKAGIMKKNSQVFTVKQPPPAMDVLNEMAKIRQCDLHVVPDYNEYNWSKCVSRKDVDLKNPTKTLNASLAIQLTHSWMKQAGHFTNNVSDNESKSINGHSIDDLVLDVSEDTLNALKISSLPGRCQTVIRHDKDVYIDGAHTIESMDVCCEWFKSNCREQSFNVLIFYVTKDRNPEPLMRSLSTIDFDMALFVPDNAFGESDGGKIIDQIDTVTMSNYKVEKCRSYAGIWKSLRRDRSGVVRVCTDVKTAMDFAVSSSGKRGKPQILVTGSLLLAGAALVVLQ